MSTLCEEAVVCNYRCFSSLLANTTNKCSRVTGQHVSEKLFVCLCSWDHTTTTPYCFYRFSSPIFFGASSGFRVAMWKALASNPNKYNNRAISSLSQWFSPVCAFFFFCLSLLGWCCILWAQGLVKGESSSSLSRTFSICRSACILLEFFPHFLSLLCGGGSVSHHSLWWNHKKARGLVTRAQQLLGDK